MLLFLGLKDKVFYGWVIVAACFVIATILVGIRHSFGVFFISLENEFELTRAVTSRVFSVYMIFCAVFTLVGGWALDRYGPRLVVSLMGLVTGLSLLLTSQADSLWQLFLSYSLLLAIGTGGGYIAVLVIVSRWFDKKRGFALGIAGSGAGLGTIVMVPFAAYLISNFGWRMSYVVIGLVALLAVIAVSMLLRNDPSEIGALPDGAKPGKGSTQLSAKEKSMPLSDFSLSQAFRTRSFWLILVIWLLLSVSVNLVLTHVIPYATDMGISTMEAATVVAVIGGFNIISRLLVGRVSDSIGRKVPGIICALLQAGALVGLIWVQELWMFYLFAIAAGFSWGGFGVVTNTLVADVFGGRNLGVIMGALDIGYAIGAAIGPAMGGVIFDVTNSYTIAFVIGAAAMLIVALLVPLTRREVNHSTYNPG